jgi:hypothetical protein
MGLYVLFLENDFDNRIIFIYNSTLTDLPLKILYRRYGTFRLLELNIFTHISHL